MAIFNYFGAFFSIFCHFAYLKLKLQYRFNLQVCFHCCGTIKQTTVHKPSFNDLDHSNKYKKWVLIGFLQSKFKGAVTQKLLINYRFRVLSVSWKSSIPAVFNFLSVCLWNLLFFRKVACYLTGSILFICNFFLWLQTLKN